LPLKTLNPPSLHREARVAALARLKELEDVSAELLRIKLAKAQEKESAKAAGPGATTRGRKK
jgi:hypothetical protein